MKMVINYLLLISLIFFYIDKTTALEQKSYELMTNVISLLSKPEDYINKTIIVEGFYIGNHQNLLYYSTEHAEQQLISYAISVLDDSEETNSLSYSSCSDEWVKIWGTFIPAPEPGVSFSQGRLVINEVMLHKNGKTCWKRTKPSFLDKAR